jgi:hypothetical protein
MLHGCVERFDVMGGRGNILGWDGKVNTGIVAEGCQVKMCTYWRLLCPVRLSAITASAWIRAPQPQQTLAVVTTRPESCIPTRGCMYSYAVATGNAKSMHVLVQCKCDVFMITASNGCAEWLLTTLHYRWRSRYVPHRFQINQYESWKSFIWYKKDVTCIRENGTDFGEVPRILRGSNRMYNCMSKYLHNERIL